MLSREQNRGTLAAPKAEDFIAELQALRIAADAESAARVFGDVHGLALAYRLTSYGQNHAIADYIAAFNRRFGHAPLKSAERGSGKIRPYPLSDRR